MEQLLIKISDTHYVIVDDSEIKEGWKGWAYKSDVKNKLFEHFYTTNPWYNDAKIITHSTQPLEDSIKLDMYEGITGIKTFKEITPLSLSEVEELIYGYNVEKLYDECDDSCSLESYANGFKKAMELTKDKLLIKDEFELGNIIRLAYLTHGNNSWVSIAKEAIQSMSPPTQWRVKFNEQGKLELV